jgi:hypothetical protein
MVAVAFYQVTLGQSERAPVVSDPVSVIAVRFHVIAKFFSLSNMKVSCSMSVISHSYLIIP